MRTGTVQREDVRFAVDGVHLKGELTTPEAAGPVVLFAHGSGSSRLSPRNRFVAQRIQDAGVGTLLFDLLSLQEEAEDRHTGHLRFDIPLLARRLQAVADQVRRRPGTEGVPVGYFGSSTGGGAALLAAARAPDGVQAVVSRGGRPDLARGALPDVRCPVLLIVGAADSQVLQMNKEARAAMTAPVELAVIPGATHLFEEPGTLGLAADRAATFFAEHLS